jgi:hypothetical protein
MKSAIIYRATFGLRPVAFEAPPPLPALLDFSDLDVDLEEEGAEPITLDPDEDEDALPSQTRLWLEVGAAVVVSMLATLAIGLTLGT